jgi:hypothetical protein
MRGSNGRLVLKSGRVSQGTANGTPLPLSRDFAAKPRRVCRKTGSVMCAGHGASNETRLRSPRHREQACVTSPYGSRSGRDAGARRHAVSIPSLLHLPECKRAAAPHSSGVATTTTSACRLHGLLPASPDGPDEPRQPRPHSQRALASSASRTVLQSSKAEARRPACLGLGQLLPFAMQARGSGPDGLAFPGLMRVW